MPQAGSPSTNGVAAPAAAKAPQNRTKPLHFCMASMLVLLDLRALFILITIYPWCFPSFLRSGKTPTKNCLELGYSNKAWFIWWDVGWVAARILGHLCFSNWEFLSGSNRQRLHHCTIIVWQRNHQLNGCCDINHQQELLDDVTCVDQVGWYDINTSS